MKMTEEIKHIFSILSHHRFVISNEKVLQSDIQAVFDEKNISYKREYILDKKSEIDFLLDNGIGIEVKIKGQKRAMYKQCLRYSEFKEIKSLILITTVSTGMPKLLNNKDVHILNLSRAWL